MFSSRFSGEERTVPEAAGQLVHGNLAVFSVHGGHDGPGEPAVDPHAGADLGGGGAQRRLHGGEKSG